MWRTRRSCGKRLLEEWLRSQQTSDLEELCMDSSAPGESRSNSTLRWKTSFFPRQKKSLFPRCSIMNQVPNRSVRAFVPRGTFPVLTSAPTIVPRGTCPPPRSTILLTLLQKILHQLSHARLSTVLSVGGTQCKPTLRHFQTPSLVTGTVPTTWNS